MEGGERVSHLSELNRAVAKRREVIEDENGSADGAVAKAEQQREAEMRRKKHDLLRGRLVRSVTRFSRASRSSAQVMPPSAAAVEGGGGGAPEGRGESPMATRPGSPMIHV